MDSPLEYIRAKKISKSHQKKGKELVETIPSLKIGDWRFKQSSRTKG